MAKSSATEKTLVIVESPAKARTISRYLGSGFEVESSIGHIRDLPSNAAEIPKEYKEENWARLGVNVNEEFKPLYVVPHGKGTQVKKLRGMLRGADRLLLATDEDREGEAIAWHLTEVLKPKCPVRRMVFDEITKSAIQAALNETRDIDQKLVDAQETRRILDRLFGYEVSPVLWRKVKPKLSAGRVQSVATRLIVEREWARMQFVSADYWDLAAQLKAPAETGTGEFDARMIELAGQRLATGKDFDENTGQLKDTGKVRLLDGDAAGRIANTLGSATFRVADVQEKPFTNRPYPPFITSTLQQEAGRKLRYTAQRTMRIAQSLYENGYITYMRTDSTTLSQQALNAARSQVRELYGDDYLPDQPRTYAKKAKNAQEAHEAIRPAGESFRTPQSLAGELNADQKKLYDLIWKRTMASQMKDAHGLRTTVRIEADAGDDGVATFTASGKVIRFPGFWRAYVEGSDDPAAEIENQEKILPPMQVGQTLDLLNVEALGHTTQPPARYTEASLIRELEERGIGRPSTYATIIQTIQDRGYVWSKSSALVPTFTAFAVVNLLKQHLPDLIDYDFTARMEDGLDAIANGDRDPTPWLRDFYFGEPGQRDGDHVADVGLKALIDNSGDAIDARAVCSIPIGKTDEGEEVVVRVGRYGPYVQLGDRDERATIPDDLAPDEVTIEKARELIEQAAQGDKALGNDPATGKPIYLKTGRFGPYVQLGDPELTEKGTVKRGGKPKMASLFPSMSMETLTLDDALELLSFPKELGQHPDSGDAITVQDGRFGPYVKCGTETRSLPDHEKLRTITLPEALELLKQPKGGGRRASSAPLAELGQHPQRDAQVSVKSGRYGPYVTDGTVNATIPKGTDPASVSLEDAVKLLTAREEKMRAEGKDPFAKRSRPTRKKSTKKKTTKKSAKKKSTRKKSTT
jgi:DNA topoisomerase-1